VIAPTDPAHTDPAHTDPGGLHAPVGASRRAHTHPAHGVGRSAVACRLPPDPAACALPSHPPIRLVEQLDDVAHLNIFTAAA
jgi:hypothetical protein